MELLCINSNIIEYTGSRHSGDGLVEGRTYTTIGKPYINDGGHQCYYIEGLGSKLCVRFTELEDSKEMISISAVKKKLFKMNLN